MSPSGQDGSIHTTINIRRYPITARGLAKIRVLFLRDPRLRSDTCWLYWRLMSMLTSALRLSRHFLPAGATNLLLRQCRSSWRVTVTLTTVAVITTSCSTNGWTLRLKGLGIKYEGVEASTDVEVIVPPTSVGSLTNNAARPAISR